MNLRNTTCSQPRELQPYIYNNLQKKNLASSYKHFAQFQHAKQYSPLPRKHLGIFKEHESPATPPARPHPDWSCACRSAGDNQDDSLAFSAPFIRNCAGILAIQHPELPRCFITMILLQTETSSIPPAYLFKSLHADLPRFILSCMQHGSPSFQEIFRTPFGISPTLLACQLPHKTHIAAKTVVVSVDLVNNCPSISRSGALRFFTLSTLKYLPRSPRPRTIMRTSPGPTSATNQAAPHTPSSHVLPDSLRALGRGGSPRKSERALLVWMAHPTCE